ncbi:MAG: hypothetical protein GXP29_09235 [Planctomycetes bacterium]|nr:hypothetical protein [Planctomycetota bacterium]
MIKTIRRTLPRPLFLFLAGLILALFAFHGLLLGYMSGQTIPSVLQTNDRIEGICSAIFALMYGGYRVFAVFPTFHLRYFKWFSTTPWRRGMPFPHGPLHLHLYWADIIVPGILCLVVWNNPVCPPVFILGAVLIGYLAAYQLELNTESRSGLGWASAFGFGLVLLAGAQGMMWLAMSTLVVLYALTLWDQRLTLDTFPWKGIGGKWDRVDVLPKLEDAADRSAAIRDSKSARSNIRTPFTALAPKKVKEGSIKEPITLSLLLGWWTYVLLTIIDSEDLRRASTPALLLIVLALPTFRFLLYTSIGRPPIGFWARLRTGNITIPGYDQIFLTPLASVVVGITVLWVGKTIGLSIPLHMASCSTAVALCLTLGPPSGSVWLYTGRHHIRWPTS